MTIVPHAERQQGRSATSSPLTRALRIAATLGMTGLTLVGAVAAVGFGSDWIATRAAEADGPVAAGAVPVSATPVVLQEGFLAPRRFLGQIEPAQRADLSFEFGGLLAEVRVDEGDSVTRGDVIARLDTRLLQTEAARLDAQKDALEARLNFAEQSLARRSALGQRGFSPDEALDSARADRDALIAQLAETGAARDANAVRIEKSGLIAPFDGRVGQRAVDTGTTVAAGQPIVGLLEDARALVRVGLPTWVDPTAHPNPVIEIAGRAYPAQLHAVRPDIDPVTRTRTALYAVETGPEAAYGQTAALTIPRRVDQRGAWVPVAALREGAQGAWTVLVVGPRAVVHAAAVEVLHAESDRAYVTGAFPEGALLVDAGPHRVTPGQSVRVAGPSG